MNKLESLKTSVIESASKRAFKHHDWYIDSHMLIVEKIAGELLSSYPEADRELVMVLVWLHDYGKILSFEDDKSATLREGRVKLEELGYTSKFVDKAIDYASIIDRKLELDLVDAPIEVRIVSSADGCSHLAGPFMAIYLRDYANKPLNELLTDNLNKAAKDWSRKIVLPEARKAFESRYIIAMEQAGKLPEQYLV
ncbi:MAG: HD domain-containing protein [Candidatus Saccharibacteria bacterium]